MKLCLRDAVFGAYLLIRTRRANAPFMFPRVTANAGPLTFITMTWKSFLAVVAPSSVTVTLILVILMSGLVAVFSAPCASSCPDRPTKKESIDTVGPTCSPPSYFENAEGSCLSPADSVHNTIAPCDAAWDRETGRAGLREPHPRPF